ncbi:dTDP-glucose pyrophosphorylase [Phormidium sp. CLA17]|uniref:nucleotidyltransferase family protein n=1 Tax=Leptolyngbya sp. Cla-17 TaxID=2803751 RepID=UPI001493195F|nr:sugar phosphate nucleotidyltransferase [Leptolyngbya sp. Cla-17]MBM0743707.1 dTDP-glucose pyrophosphorylase [Leptolyngbya sp. Cla-17]
MSNPLNSPPGSAEWVPRSSLEVIGLIPCGGQATRISPLPFSKELYPIGFQPGRDNKPRPKVVCHYLLEQMRLAGITKTYFILRSGKWDIPAYFGDGAMVEMHLGYLLMGLSYGVPYTLDQAFPFVKQALVALGFPDILLQPDDSYARLIARQRRTQADVVLGLFPCDRPEKAGMVDFDETGKVHLIIEKPLQTNLRFMWGAAVWNPVFTDFLSQYVVAEERKFSQEGNLKPRKEIPIGDVIQAAITAGLRVEAEPFERGTYLDIGTPDDLVKAVRQYCQ